MNGRHVLRLTGVLLFLAAGAPAQNQRSAVSVTGLDTNLCTVPAPCRSFAVAMTHTNANANGDIVALTSGGYGPFTVDRSVTVLGAPGVYAGVTATSGSGIVINAGAGGKVTLRNLFVNGSGLGGVGISVTGSGDETNIENCVISNFVDYGVVAFLNVRICDTTIRSCGYGIWIDNAVTAVKGSIDRVHVAHIHGGNDAHGTGIAILSFRHAVVTVSDSVVTDAETGVKVDTGKLLAENSIVTQSTIGILSTTGGTARLSNNVVTRNGTGWRILLATIETFGNNKVRGNTTADIDNVGNLGIITTLSEN